MFFPSNMFAALGIKQLAQNTGGKMFSTLPFMLRTQFARAGAPRGFASARAVTLKSSPNILLTALGIGGVGTAYALGHSKVLNDSAITYGSGLESNVKSVEAKLDPNAGPRFDGAFNGKLNYRQVALGSAFGMGVGFCISRLSSVLFVLTVGFYLLGVYLKKQGIQLIDTRGVVRGAANSVDWEDLLFNQISFSVPFISSFLFSATL